MGDADAVSRRNVSELVLDDGRSMVDVFDSTINVTFNEDIDQSPTITITVADRTRRFLQSGLMARYNDATDNVDLQIRSVWYRLVQVQRQGGRLLLTFEDRSVTILRAQKQAATFTRGVFTMAEAARALVRRVRSPEIPFESPELRVVQPIASSKNTTRNADANAARAAGFAKGVKITVKHATATSVQRSNLAKVLAVGVSLKASTTVLEAAVATVTQEATAKNLTGGDGTSTGIFQIISSNVPSGAKDQRRDIEWASRWFYDQAIPLQKKSPSISPGDLAQAVQRSAYPQAYKQWSGEAAKTVTAYLGSAGTAAASVRTRETTGYQYIQAKGTDTWTTLKTWADSVAWRRFAVANTVYFTADRDLLNSRGRATLSEDTAGVDSIDFDIDQGKVTETATITCHIDYWTAPCGTCIVLEDMGPADGVWIVATRSGDFAQTTVSVGLVRPVHNLPEPASTTLTTAASKVSKPLAKAYAEAVKISKAKYVYVYGGGHSVVGVPSAGVYGTGLDCSGLVSAVLHAGGWTKKPLDTVALGTFGVAGKGQYMTIWVNPKPGQNGHTFIDFHMPGHAVERFEAHGPEGAPIRLESPTGSDLTPAGMVARHVKDF